MKFCIGVLMLGLLAAPGCIHRESDYSNVESSPQDWQLPGPNRDAAVFGPMPYDEVKDFVQQKESEGWRVAGYEPAGPFSEGRYIVILKRWASR